MTFIFFSSQASLEKIIRLFLCFKICFETIFVAETILMRELSKDAFDEKKIHRHFYALNFSFRLSTIYMHVVIMCCL